MDNSNNNNSEQDNKGHFYLILFNVLTGFLFIMSEVFSMSTCESNGVIQFIIGDCLGNKKKVYVHIRIGEEEVVPLLNDL